MKVLKRILLLIINNLNPLLFIPLAALSQSDSVPLAVKKGVHSSEEKYSIVLNTQYKQNKVSSYNNNVDFVYSHNKWQINASVGYKINRDFTESDLSTFFPRSNTFVSLGTSNSKYKSFTSFIDAQYSISRKDKINIFVINDLNKNNFSGENTISIYDDQYKLNRTYSGERLLTSTTNRHSVNALFRHDFNTANRYFTLEADWMKKFVDYHQYTNGQDYDINGSAIPNKLFAASHGGTTDLNIYSLNGFVNIPNKWVDLSLEGKWVYVKFDCDINYFSKENTIYKIVPELSPLSNYTENRQSLSIELRKKISNWSFKTVIKAENTRSETSLENTIYTRKRNNYINLFPTADVTHHINANESISLSYARRIIRPPFRFLNPSISIYHAYETYFGNPFVKPAFANDISLQYSYKSKYTLNLTHSSISDNIWSLTYFTPEQVISHIVANYMNLRTLQLTGSARLKYSDAIGSYLQLRGQYKYNTSNVAAIDDISRWGWYAMINNDFNINRSKSLSGYVNFWFRSNDLQQETIIRDQASLDLGVKMLLLNNDLTVRFDMTDILGTMTENKSLTASGVRQEFRSYWEPPRSFKISLSYRIGNKKLNYAERQSSSATDHRR